MIRSESFSRSYAQARAKLLVAARVAEAGCTSFLAPTTGAEGEPLAVDVVRLGPADARHVVLVTSGCHGVEGYAGSAAQICALRDGALGRRLARSNSALWIVHALNPHGFSLGRRWTSEGVDLNRNVIEFDEPRPVNEDYATLHDLLVTAAWPPSGENERRLAGWIRQWGMRRFQEAVTRGQYEFADGLFFGGSRPTWSRRTFGAILGKLRERARAVAWIDIHTGLGPCGLGERIFTGGGPRAESFARQWWGEVTRTEDGTSSSAGLTGTLAGLVLRELGDRALSFLTLEFGTVPPMQVLEALRMDAWAHRPDACDDQARRRSAARMRETFFVETAAWKEAVLDQSMEVLDAAVAGLEQSPGGASGRQTPRRRTACG